jgi:starch phosphorylase
MTRQLAASGLGTEVVDWAKTLFHPDALTLGFARRFATYKRPNLLLHDPARLVGILSSAERPVQLIIARKAHPDDQGGRALIREWIQFIRRSGVRPHGGPPCPDSRCFRWGTPTPSSTRRIACPG